ncbi:hypothetical protein GF354_05815 [Candidatus Peregrinibacteria bacterium]|nr:hypothetical protein [Candidatus Peregrinibacteria bacterium]
MYDLWEKSLRHGLKKGLISEDAEDYASFVVEQKIKSPNRRIYMKTAFADYMRYRYGRLDKKYFKEKEAVTRPLVVPEPKAKTFDVKNPATNVFALAKPEIRPYIICRYYFDLTNHDIGLIFNKHYAVISRAITNELRRIHDVIKKEGC